MPHAPLLMLPVTGLPPQVTTQSTPALTLSPTGIMLSFAVPAIASEVTAPLAPVMEMGAAFAPEMEPLPQPAIIVPSIAAQTPAQS